MEVQAGLAVPSMDENEADEVTPRCFALAWTLLLLLLLFSTMVLMETEDEAAEGWRRRFVPAGRDTGRRRPAVVDIKYVSWPPLSFCDPTAPFAPLGASTLIRFNFCEPEVAMEGRGEIFTSDAEDRKLL